MEKIRDVSLKPLVKSKFLIPLHIQYNQNGKKKVWECISEHSDVAILLFNTSRNKFVFVKQFRPAVYVYNSEIELINDKEVIDTDKYPGHLGITIELCAGIIDKDEPLIQIAQAEVLEECGYDVSVENLRKITSFRNGVGSTGAVVNLYYAEVTDSMRVGEGGGLACEGELIEVVEMSVSEAQALMYNETVNREAGLLFALQWFFNQIWPNRMKKEKI